MRILPITELMRLARAELCGLLARIAIELPNFPINSPESAIAHTNLRSIRAALAEKSFQAVLLRSLRLHPEPSAAGQRRAFLQAIVMAALATSSLSIPCMTIFRTHAFVRRRFWTDTG